MASRVRILKPPPDQEPFRLAAASHTDAPGGLIGNRAIRVFIALCAVTFACALRPARAQTLQTLMTNGPASNRLNIVFLSEGYTSNQLATNLFLIHATNALNNFFAYQPYQEYKSYCNVYAIAVPSNQQGSDHPQYGFFNDTYFNSSYDAVYDRIVTIPPNDQDPTAAHGQGKVDALLQSLMPQSGLAIMLVNDLVDGGSGGATCIASPRGASFPELLVHETGHTLGRLGDEYGFGYGSEFANFPNTEEPNTTTNTNRLTIKWNAWIATNTPIPTPSTNLYSTNVGLFLGAHYNSNSWYRPKLNCRMAVLDSSVPFCEVCSETLVKAIYAKARPIDAFSPATNGTVSITTAQAVPFSVTPLQPMTHSLSVQWFTNGTALAGATNSTFNLVPAAFTNGAYTLKAQVRDLTPLVRMDSSNLLSNAVSWAVSINVNQLQLDTLRWLAGSKFAFRVAGTAPHGFVIQGSTNLTAWTALSTNNLAGGQFFFTNSAASFNRRYYRTLLLP